MRVFVTGASGFIGSAIVRELLLAGHQVTGLARSDAAADAIAASGAEVVRGALDDHAGLHRAAAAADGVIHTAFIHDFANYAQSGVTDHGAVKAIGAALAGTARPLIVTSAITVLQGNNGVARETDTPHAGAISAIRMPAEQTVQALARHGVRAVALRLPPSVHGHGDRGFLPALIAIARATGVAAYVGDGANRWPAVHRLDVAQLFRLALEAAPAGAVLHGVADEGIAFKSIAELIGRQLGLPVVSLAPDAASGHFGWLGQMVSHDMAASSDFTRSLLAWRPVQRSLLHDIDSNFYFNPAR